MHDLASTLGAVGGIGGLLLFVFALLFGAIWMVMPFVVLAMNRRLGQTVEEMRYQNELLARWLEIKDAAGMAAVQPAPPQAQRPAEPRRPQLVRPEAEAAPEPELPERAVEDAPARPARRPREARVEPHL